VNSWIICLQICLPARDFRAFLTPRMK
jgi:hypothetical protein